MPGAPYLEHEAAAGARGAADLVNGLLPGLVGQEDLGHVPGHDRQASRERQGPRGLAGTA
jgi:hypothetical protein